MARVVALRSLMLLGLAACGDTAIRQPDGDAAPLISQSCLDAEDHDDFEWIQEFIFTPSCSRFSSCHKGNATSAARLNLEDGRALMNLLGTAEMPKTSRVCGEPQRLVTPGDPANSYLMKVLDPDRFPLPDPVGPGTDCPEGDPEEPPETMPYNNPLLCEQKRGAVERWILALPPLEPVTDAGVPDAMPDAR